MSAPHVRIVGGPTAMQTRILIGDKLIPGVVEVTVHAKIGEANRAVLHLVGVELDVEAEHKRRWKLPWRR